jgi:hypothetical protein
MVLLSPSSPQTASGIATETEPPPAGAETVWPSFHVHPGHVLLFTSLPICYGAFRDYNKSIEDLACDILKRQTGGRVKIDNLLAAEANVRRAVGAGIASRALSVATRGSIGIFAFSGAMIFYASGCSTINEAAQATRESAQSGRRKFYSYLGVKDPFGEDHPDYIATRGMTEEQELDYISKTYFSYSETEEAGKKA